MLQEKINYLVSCQFLPKSVRDFLPWETEPVPVDPVTGERKVRPVLRCRRCGLCMTGSKTCPVLDNKPLE